MLGVIYKGERYVKIEATFRLFEAPADVALQCRVVDFDHLALCLRNFRIARHDGNNLGGEDDRKIRRPLRLNLDDIGVD